MNLRKKSKKTILSGLIALALSGSMAFAMPQGGTVVAGNVSVTNGSLADLVNGGTLNVQGNSLIDWNSFNIGQNETLNVIFNSGANMLINHVTGSEISQLLGTLNAVQGKGNFMLINPNGIVVGPQAQLNVGSLLLSTLDASDNQLLNMLGNGGTVEFTDTKNGVLDIQGGAKINVGDLLNLYGGKIQIADGVTISNDLQLLTPNGENQIHPAAENKLQDATIVAADSVTREWEVVGTNGNRHWNIASEKHILTPQNTVSIKGAQFVNAAKEFSLAIGGGTITTSGTKFGSAENPLSETHLTAASSEEARIIDQDKDICEMVTTATKDNVLQLTDTDVHVKPNGSNSCGIALDGGVVNIKEDSNLQADDYAYMKIRAFGKMTDREEDAISLENSPMNKITVENSTLNANNGSIGLTAGSLQIDNSTINVSDGALRMMAVNNARINNLYDDKKHKDIGALKGPASGGAGNTILINNGSKLIATISANGKQYLLQKDANLFDKGRMLIGAYAIKANDSTWDVTDRIEAYAIGGADGEVRHTVDGNEIIMNNMELNGGDIALVGKKISLLGDSKVNVPDDRYFVPAAGSEIILSSGASNYDKDTYTGIEKADGKVELSQTAYDNLEKANTLPQEEGYYKIVKDIPQPEVKPQPETKPEVKPAPEEKPQSEVKPETKPVPEEKPQPEIKPEVKPTVEEKSQPEQSTVDTDKTAAAVRDIVKDKNLSDAQKQEKLQEKKAEIREAVNVMEKRDGVRGHMDKAISAAPAPQVSRPAATATEPANVTAGEGVMSANDNAVTGVEKK